VVPGVDAQAEGGQPGQVRRGLLDGRPGDAGQPLAPRRAGGQLTQQGVRGLAEVAGDLDGEPAAGSEQAGEPVEERQVVGHPLQGGVADEHVDGRLWRPRAQVGEGVADAVRAVLGLRSRDHLGRVVDALDAGRRPALGELPGERPGPAAEVGDHAAAPGQDAGREAVEDLAVERLAGQLVADLRGVPLGDRVVAPTGAALRIGHAP
jgi:hypothetical protein